MSDEDEMQTVECCATYLPSKSGPPFFNEESALIELLADDVLFASDGDHAIEIVVCCNDLFWWASADAEELKHSELESLYQAWKAGGADLAARHTAVARWVCLKRQMRPQYCVEQEWRRAGTWDAALDALPERANDFLNPKIDDVAKHFGAKVEP